jgi:hypothetical protein
MNSKRHFSKAVLIAIFFLIQNVSTVRATGFWTPLTNQAPDYISLMLLLSDGTVMAANAGGNDWYRLTPDIHGSYVNGSWTSLASMHYTRLYFASDVLTNGMVLVAGGEYGTGSSKSEIYDPLRNVWTDIPVPSGILTNGGFQDSISKILPNGNVLVAPNKPATNGYTAMYITISNTWVVGPKLFRGNAQAECSWVKLPDDSILTVDRSGLTNSERYIPSLNEWVNDSKLPTQIHSTLDAELGAALLLPNGQAIFLGGNGNTALYTPTRTTAKGSWTAGPVIPNGFGINDGPAAMMVNGKILCAVGNSASYRAPAYFFEYDPIANSFTQVNGPTGVTDNVPPYEGVMLDLPDGTVLYSHDGTDLYVYQPDGSPLAAGKPAISSIIANVDGSFTLAGVQLNGISEGAAYGDDAQMNSNYPLIRLTDSAGNVYYERTYNWNSTSVMTGNRLVTTQFTNSAALPFGNYSLVVLANGISSDSISFSFSDYPLPTLNFAQFGQNFVITWLTNFSGFTLESTTNLAVQNSWTAVTPLPVIVNDQYTFTNTSTVGIKFYRLEK